MQDFLSLVAAAGGQSIWGLIEQASVTVKLVMALLALMSVVGWYVIGYKYFYIRRATKETARFTDSFWRSRDIEQIYKHAQALRHSPVSAMFLAGYTELAKLQSDERPNRDRDADLDNVERSLRKAQTTEITKLESMVPFLATTGSSAPFIGLFGTVWGIMESFRALTSSTGSTTIDAVAPGIAEALLATAIGLVAAIPAVMAYNYFQRQIRIQASAMDTFTQDYLNIIRRHFLT
jgi:biopolymer transport protein TolQ